MKVPGFWILVLCLYLSVPSEHATIKASFPTVGHGGENEKKENANLSQNRFP